jgi:hypothetical protein
MVDSDRNASKYISTEVSNREEPAAKKKVAQNPSASELLPEIESSNKKKSKRVPVPAGQGSPQQIKRNASQGNIPKTSTSGSAVQAEVTILLGPGSPSSVQGVEQQRPLYRDKNS